MCAATAAAIGSAAAAAASAAAPAAGAVAGIASAGMGIYSAVAGGGGGGGGAGSLVQRKLSGFAPMTGLQSYAARTLAANVNTRPPTFDEWVSSGGKAKYEFVDPGFTPMEARQLKFVDSHGNPIPYYDPETQIDEGLTNEQLAQMGRERKFRKKDQPNSDKYPIQPEERVATLYRRQQQLQARIDRREGAGRPMSMAQERRLQDLEDKMDRIRGKVNRGED